MSSSNERESEKQSIREKVWARMQSEGVARFPGARGRIPNFVGAERCAEALDRLDVWQAARVIKSNPDSPQRAIRYRALREGKRLYMAAPRLRQEACFIELDPKKIGEKKYWEASSIAGAGRFGRAVTVEELPQIDLIVCGSVAVSREGGRIGKGEATPIWSLPWRRKRERSNRTRRSSPAFTLCKYSINPSPGRCMTFRSTLFSHPKG